MVRTWGAFGDASELEAVVPTLQHWAELLGGGGPAATASSGTRPPFRPPAVALWRAVHGLLPLLRGSAGVALLQHVPRLAGAVLAWVSCQREESELCTWFAISCWSYLLAAAGPATFNHIATSPAAIVQQLVAAAAGSTSERLHKAAAEAVAAMLLHAASAGSAFGEAVAALRRGFLFLLQDIPLAAAAGPGSEQQQQQPRYSQLAASVAEAAAFSALLQLLEQGGSAAEAALHCAHYWVPPLCATLRLHGGDAAAAQQPQRSPSLFAAADRAALRLAAALLAGEAAALSGAASSSSEDTAVAAVAAAAAEQAGAWQCLPALWHALASSTGSPECSALLLSAAASLSPAAGPCGASAAAGASGAGPTPAGFAAPVLASSLGADIAAARRPLPLQALRGVCLAEGEAPPLLHSCLRCWHWAALSAPGIFSLPVETGAPCFSLHGSSLMLTPPQMHPSPRQQPSQ